MKLHAAHVCLITLGGQPQVVTLALDALFAQGILISEVILVHLSSQNARYRAALDRLHQEFVNDQYRPYGDGKAIPCRYRPIAITQNLQPVVDLDSETAIEATQQLFRERILELKRQGKTIHLCIAGGRRLMGVFALTTAMLYFDESDRIWHLFSSDAVREETKEGKVMHLPHHPEVALVRIRIPAWGNIFPFLRDRDLSTIGVNDAIDQGNARLIQEERHRCQQVIGRLTPRVRETLELLAKGLTIQEVANKMNLVAATVRGYQTTIIQECSNVWGQDESEQTPTRRIDRHWIREKFAPYYRE